MSEKQAHFQIFLYASHLRGHDIIQMSVVHRNCCVTYIEQQRNIQSDTCTKTTSVF